MLRPDEFIARLQADHRLGELWVGSDFAMGRGRSGTIAALVKIGSQLPGFALHVVPPVSGARDRQQHRISGALLAQGDITRAMSCWATATR